MAVKKVLTLISEEKKKNLLITQAIVAAYTFLREIRQ